MAGVCTEARPLWYEPARARNHRTRSGRIRIKIKIKRCLWTRDKKHVHAKLGVMAATTGEEGMDGKALKICRNLSDACAYMYLHGCTYIHSYACSLLAETMYSTTTEGRTGRAGRSVRKKRRPGHKNGWCKYIKLFGEPIKGRSTIFRHLLAILSGFCLRTHTIL